jgi:hypothetical protein
MRQPGNLPLDAVPAGEPSAETRSAPMALPAQPAVTDHRARPVVVYFVRDLFFGVRITEGLARLAIDARPLTPATATEDLARASLAIVDLSAPVAQWQPLLHAAAAGDVPVLAFGSHLDQERWRLARAGGASRIVANSQLVAQFPELVRRLLKVPQGSEPPGG